MIYKNEDDSIYKIEIPLSPAMPSQGVNENEVIKFNAINSNREQIEEVAEVLNYLLKKTKHLPRETIELPKPNDGEVVTKA